MATRWLAAVALLLALQHGCHDGSSDAAVQKHVSKLPPLLSLLSDFQWLSLFSYSTCFAHYMRYGFDQDPQYRLLLSQDEVFTGKHPACGHTSAVQLAHGARRRLQAVAADGGSAPELVPDVLHGEQVAAAKQGLERQDAASDAADPGKNHALDESQGGHGNSGDNDPDFQPAAFQQQLHSRLRRDAATVDAAYHVADQLQPSQQLAQQRAQETEMVQNQLLLESLKAKDAQQHDGQHDGGSPGAEAGGSHDAAAGSSGGHEAGHSGFEASAAQQRRLAAHATELASGASQHEPEDSHAARQQHLQARHDAKYAQHLSRSMHSPPGDAQQQVGGGVAPHQVTSNADNLASFEQRKAAPARRYETGRTDRLCFSLRRARMAVQMGSASPG